MTDEEKKRRVSIRPETIRQLYYVASAAEKVLDDLLNAKPNALHIRLLVGWLARLDSESAYDKKNDHFHEYLCRRAYEFNEHNADYKEGFNRINFHYGWITLWHQPKKKKAEDKEAEA